MTRTWRGLVSELASYSPRVIEADPAYLAALVRRAAPALGLPLHQPELVVLTYSYPSLAHLAESAGPSARRS